MNDKEITFEHYDRKKNEYIKMNIKSTETNLYEIKEKFNNFLKACGYTTIAASAIPAPNVQPHSTSILSLSSNQLTTITPLTIQSISSMDGFLPYNPEINISIDDSNFSLSNAAGQPTLNLS